MENKNSSENTPAAEQPSVQSTPNPTPKTRSNALLLGIAGLIILIIGAALGFYLANNTKNEPTQKLTQTTPTLTPAPTADETANWKTYTDSTYKFSFQYPSYWMTPKAQLADNAQNQKPHISLDFVNTADSNNPSSKSLSVNVFSNASNLSLYDWLNIVYANPGGTNPTPGTLYDKPIPAQPNASVSNMPAISVYGGGGNAPLIRYYFIKGNGYIYDIEISPYNETLMNEVYSKILSTFKFTELTSVSPTTQEMRSCSTDADCSNGYICMNGAPDKHCVQNSKTTQ